MSDATSTPDAAIKPVRVYFAGELFSAKHLLGNACLCEAIHAASNGRYLPVLPQNIELRSQHPHDIRDQDIRLLLSCDAALFNYDGPELDSGTVVEFLFAKFADIPSVLLRTDFRSAGDQGPSGDPWNLMTSFYPRTRTVLFPAMAAYKNGPALGGPGVDVAHSLRTRASSSRGMEVLRQAAGDVITALDAVCAQPRIMPAEVEPAIREWLEIMPGYRTRVESATRSAARTASVTRSAS